MGAPGEGERRIGRKSGLDGWLNGSSCFVKHFKEVVSISASDVDVLYADLGIAHEDS
ncbi:hypothetical protein Hdeb2414_s0005g00187551 [Helianthus debilis subsp. tardiflorus]